MVDAPGIRCSITALQMEGIIGIRRRPQTMMDRHRRDMCLQIVHLQARMAKHRPTIRRRE